MATCEIISVGTELLLGDILNTDAQFLSRQLAMLGIGGSAGRVLVPSYGVADD